MSPLVETLGRDHHDIDARIAAFLYSIDQEQADLPGLQQTLQQLQHHIYLEEVFLFPALTAPQLRPALFGMLRTHGLIWQQLDVLQQAGEYTTGMRKQAENLAEQLALHNKTEEPVIYGAIDQQLDADTQQQLLHNFQVQQRPQEWICARAKTN